MHPPAAAAAAAAAAAKCGSPQLLAQPPSYSLHYRLPDGRVLPEDQGSRALAEQ